jgi:predicted phosphate transport protein (TIGR00153 family)
MARNSRLQRFRLRISWGAGPGQREVLGYLAEAGENARQAAELAAELFATWPDDTSRLRTEIAACEDRGDELTRRIVHTIHRSKLAPFDRGDIYRLATAIDDVVDDIEEAAEETAIYQIEAPLEQAQALAGVLRDAARDLAAALAGLTTGESVEEHLQGVRQREHEGDRIYRDALAALFDGGVDPMVIIRWKDVLGAIEEAIDRSRHAADHLQQILVKHR